MTSQNTITSSRSVLVCGRSHVCAPSPHRELRIYLFLVCQEGEHDWYDDSMLTYIRKLWLRLSRLCGNHSRVHVTDIRPLRVVVRATPLPTVILSTAREVQFEVEFNELRRMEQDQIMLKHKLPVKSWPSSSQHSSLPLWQRQIVNRVRLASPHVFPSGSTSAPVFIQFEWQCLDFLRLQMGLPGQKWPTQIERDRLSPLEQQILCRAESRFHDPAYKGARTV